MRNSICGMDLRNGKNEMTGMDTGGWECLVYRIVGCPQPWEMRNLRARIFSRLWNFY